MENGHNNRFLTEIESMGHNGWMSTARTVHCIVLWRRYLDQL